MTGAGGSATLWCDMTKLADSLLINSVPVSGGGGGGPGYFDPNNIGPYIALSNENKTARTTSAVWNSGSAILDTYTTKDKFWWEVVYETWSNRLMPGVCNPSFDPKINYAGADPAGNSVAIFSYGGTFYQGLTGNNGPQFPSPISIIGIGIDKINAAIALDFNGVPAVTYSLPALLANSAELTFAYCSYYVPTQVTCHTHASELQYAPRAGFEAIF